MQILYLCVLLLPKNKLYNVQQTQLFQALKIYVSTYINLKVNLIT